MAGENGREKNGGREGGGKMAGTCADGLAVGLHRKWREKLARIRAGRRKFGGEAVPTAWPSAHFTPFATC